MVLRGVSQPEQHHNVQVVLLGPAVGRIRKVRAENPERDPKKPCVHVGIPIPYAHRIPTLDNIVIYGGDTVGIRRDYGQAPYVMELMLVTI